MASITTENMIIKGLSIQHPISGVLNKSLVIISPGLISFSNLKQDSSIIVWDYTKDYMLASDYSLSIAPNGNNLDRIDVIYAKPNTLIRSGVNVCSLDFSVIQGTPALSPLASTYIDGWAFLGIILVPGLYPSINKQIYIKSKNISSESITLAQTSDEWINLIKQNINTWTSDTLYLEDQIIRNGTLLYRCKVSHGSPTLFSTNQSYYWESIAGIPESSDCESCFVEETETSNGVDYVVTYLITYNQGEEIRVAVSSYILE